LFSLYFYRAEGMKKPPNTDGFLLFEDGCKQPLPGSGFFSFFRDDFLTRFSCLNFTLTL
jgi:hypothetical protein